MKKTFILLIGIVLATLITGIFTVWYCPACRQKLFPQKEAPAATFQECVDRGYPVMESYPRQCRTPEGRVFIEDIGNELEKADLIRVSNPRPNQSVASPLTINGEARGYWFFEASFPVVLFDAEGNTLAQGIAQAKSDWMTEDFVPFESELQFAAPATVEGNLVLKKDNPSGLPENDDELIVPVLFSQVSQLPNPASVYCEQQGGTEENRDFTAGTKGFCIFDDDSECDEWNLMRGNCHAGEIFCKDLCGDSQCQEIVCAAVGCPCAETPVSCPQDCGE